MAIDKTDAAKEIDNAENVPGLVAHVKRKFTYWLQYKSNKRKVANYTSKHIISKRFYDVGWWRKIIALYYGFRDIRRRRKTK